MYPVNQFIMGQDPVMNTLGDLDMQIKKMEECRRKLKEINVTNNCPLWDEIDKEMLSMSDAEKCHLMDDDEYASTYGALQQMVQNELLHLVKEKIETSDEGKRLLKAQLDRLRVLKKEISDKVMGDVELFNQFRELSKTNHELTYDEFIKNINK